MNKAIRKQISDMAAKLTTVKEQLDLDFRGDIETIKDGEQEKFDNMPEGLQGGEPGTKLESVIDTLESAMDALQLACDEIDNCISYLNEIE